MVIKSELAVHWSTTTRAGRHSEHRLRATTPDGTQYTSAAYNERSARLEWLFRDAIDRHQTGRRVTVVETAPRCFSIPASL